MKAKFKKDFIKSFNEKYNYENESLLKEITPKQPILKRRRLCYLSIILITMLLSVSITYVVVRNRLLHDNDDPLYNEMIDYSEKELLCDDIKELTKINILGYDDIYLYYKEIDNKLVILIGIQTNYINDSVNLIINEEKIFYTKKERLEIFEIRVEKATDYNISLEYYINDEIQLKFVENLKI